MKDKLLISKMLDYIIELKGFIKDYDYEMFVNDKKTINASVFNLSQIGEIATKISEETQKCYPRD